MRHSVHKTPRGTAAVLLAALVIAVAFRGPFHAAAQALPTIASISPSEGNIDTRVTISGSGFLAGAAVYFGGVPGQSTNVIGGSTIITFAPAHALGTVDVMVTNPGGGSATAPNAFKYVGDTPRTTGSIAIPAQGFGLFVFGPGTTDGLVRAAGCAAPSLTFWAATGGGGFVTYVPGTTITAVNAAWNAMFASGIPAATALIGRCT